MERRLVPARDAPGSDHAETRPASRAHARPASRVMVPPGDDPSSQTVVAPAPKHIVRRTVEPLDKPATSSPPATRIHPIQRQPVPAIQRKVSGGKSGDKVVHENGKTFTIVERVEESGEILYVLQPDEGGERFRVFGDVRAFNLVATPSAPSTVPEPPSTVPEPPSTVPEPPSTVPEPPSTVPEPPSTVPEPPSTVPEPPGATTGVVPGPPGPTSAKKLPGLPGLPGVPASAPTAAVTAPVTAPTGPGAISPGQLALLTVDVAPSDLDKGSKLLKEIRAKRSATVNQGGADALSNCAVTTLAGITARGSSKDVAADIQKKIFTVDDPSGVQSEKMWAIGILDAETLKDAGLLKQGPAAVKEQRKKNQQGAKDMDAFAQGRSFALGSAQYFGLLKYLMSVAQTDATDEVTYALYRYGLPGGPMYAEAALIAQMKKYENGTRFAVFVISHDQNTARHVKQHYVYAEKFNGAVIFQDFQTNKRGSPADAYLEKFPFSPDPKDNKGTFDEGCFVAIAPTFKGETTATPPGDAIAASEIAKELDLAQMHTTAYASKVSEPNALPTSWPSLYRPSALAEIPAPSAVQAGYQTLAGQLGVRATCKFDLTGPGVVKMIGNPEHAVFGSKAVINIKMLNATTNVVKPGVKGAAPDATELPVPAAKSQVRWSPEAEEEEYGAFSKSYNVAAQNTAEGITINAEMAQFTDLIHEVAHAHEQGNLPPHIREGCADVFASMVTHNLKTDFADGRFDFAFNPSYAPFVVAVHQLVDVLGLTPVARMYFQSTDPKADLRTLVATKLGPSRSGEVDSITGQLLDEGGFPGSWKKGIEQLSGGKPAKSSGSPGSFDAARGDFEAKLERERKPSMSTAELLEVAQSWSDRDGLEVMEKRLTLLYRQADEASGASYVEVMKLIHTHEVGICAITHEEREDLKKRLTKKAYAP